MSQIQIWQVAVDLGLVMTILFMGMRLIRSSGVSSMIPRTVELESSLRSLIGEADVAGRSLNDQLLRREQNLQKLLTELEAIEQRISRTMIEAEERQVALGSEVEKAQQVSEEVSRGLRDIQRELGTQEAAPQPQAPRQAQSRTQPAAAAKRPQPIPLARSVEAITDPESFEPEMPAPGVRVPAKQRIEVRNNQAQAPQAKIQGNGDVYPSGDRLKAMQDVYRTAEELLRAGADPDRVSEQTRLNVEQVRLLSQMIEIERDEENERPSKRNADDRLGVLGAMRRQVQTL